jgi:2-polyprenyl-3-methyl-5-hydroxy-6-metoxy-1,4-benzoquinol methylase
MNVTYLMCPVCSSNYIHNKLTATDHTVSHENFEIWECKACTLRFTQNVPNESKIGRYYESEDYISHSDTKKGLINSLYHKVRKRTLVGKRDAIIKYTGLKKGSILDIGAGTGAFLNTMKSAGWESTGIEPSKNVRDAAQKLYSLTLQSVESFELLPTASFDAITMWHVLEHVHDLRGYMARLKALLKPNGRLFIAVPNYTSYDARAYKEFWAAYDVPRHLYHFSPLSMRQLLKEEELKLQQICPMWFDSFYVSMLSEKYKSGKNNYLGAFTTGLLSNVKALANKEKCSSLIYIIGK